MNRGHLYKHKNMVDVCFMPSKIFYVKEKGIYKIQGTWYSDMPWRDPMCMGFTDKFELTRKQITEWRWVPEKKTKQ